MRKITRTALATTAVAGLLALPVAASADTTTVTFTVENNGGLAATSADTAPNLGTFDTSGSMTATATLPEMTITDNTNPLGGGWSVTVDAVDFVNGDSSETVPGSAVGYWSGAATPAVGSVVAPVGGQLSSVVAETLDAQVTAVTATLATGNNTTTFTPTLEFDFTGIANDTYTGDIVHSVTAS